MAGKLPGSGPQVFSHGCRCFLHPQPPAHPWGSGCSRGIGGQEEAAQQDLWISPGHRWPAALARETAISGLRTLSWRWQQWLELPSHTPFLCQLQATQISDTASSRPRQRRGAWRCSEPWGPRKGLLLTGGRVRDSQMLCLDPAPRGLLEPRVAEGAGPWPPHRDRALARAEPANTSSLG